MIILKLQRPLVASAIALAALVGIAGPAAATVFPSVPVVPVAGGLLGPAATTACVSLPNATIGLASGAGPVTKTIERSDNSNGSTDFKVTLTGAIPALFLAGYALDCVWIDTNTNGLLDIGETTSAYLTTTPIGVGGSGPTRTMIFQLNVPAASGKQVCDRAFGGSIANITSAATSTSGLANGSWASLYSGNVCSAPTPEPVVPEAPLVPMLLGSAGALAAGISYLSRRKRIAVV